MAKETILIVEDEKTTRHLLKVSLMDAGYKVNEATTGREALEILDDIKPSLIVLDIVMPDMDGYSLIKKIKDTPVIRNIPIIISSGKSGMKDFFNLEDKIYRPDAFISKPYKMKDLLEIIRKIL